MPTERFILICLIFLGSFSLFSQEIDDTNTDSIYFKALELYKNQNYQLSLKYTNRGLELAKDYHDIRVLRVRNAWAVKDFKKAENDIFYLLQNAPEYPGVQELAERQTMMYPEIEARLAYLEELGKKISPSNHLKLLKSSLYLKAGKPKEAREIAMNLFQNSDLDKDLRYQLQNILTRTVSDEIGVNYQYIHFDQAYSRNDPWNSISAEYLHYFNRTALIGRVLYTDRSYDQGYLYELESYPVFSDKVYAQLTAGFSNGDIYPDFRGSASVFINFLKTLEAETGGRVLHFGDKDYFTGIIGLTTYTGKFYLNLRSFIGPKRMNQMVQNYQFNIRYYFKDIDNYLFGRIGSGISPDEKTIFTQVQENPGLDAYYLNLGLNKMIGIHHVFQISGGYLIEDIDQNNKGKQFLAGVSYRYRF